MSGSILHVVGVCINRIGTLRSSHRIRRRGRHRPRQICQQLLLPRSPRNPRQHRAAPQYACRQPVPGAPRSRLLARRAGISLPTPQPQSRNPQRQTSGLLAIYLTCWHVYNGVCNRRVRVLAGHSKQQGKSSPRSWPRVPKLPVIEFQQLRKGKYFTAGTLLSRKYWEIQPLALRSGKLSRTLRVRMSERMLPAAHPRRRPPRQCRLHHPGADRRPAGAELLGTRPDHPFRGMAPGSRKARGGFWIARRKQPQSSLIVESAVDALSAFELPCMKDTDLFLSTAGLANRMPPWIAAFHLQHIACGYDADPPGDQAAERLIRANPNIRRIRPTGQKDWKGVLQSRNRKPIQNRAATPQHSEPDPGTA